MPMGLPSSFNQLRCDSWVIAPFLLRIFLQHTVEQDRAPHVLPYHWRGQPLESRATVIELIANTTTKTGLKVECALDEQTYGKGIRINDKMRQLAIEGDAFHPEWNYTIKPRNPKQP
jgi:hypothetical protein